MFPLCWTSCLGMTHGQIVEFTGYLNGKSYWMSYCILFRIIPGHATYFLHIFWKYLLCGLLTSAMHLRKSPLLTSWGVVMKSWHCSACLLESTEMLGLRMCAIVWVPPGRPKLNYVLWWLWYVVGSFGTKRACVAFSFAHPFVSPSDALEHAFPALATGVGALYWSWGKRCFPERHK